MCRRPRTCPAHAECRDGLRAVSSAAGRRVRAHARGRAPDHRAAGSRSALRESRLEDAAVALRLVDARAEDRDPPALGERGELAELRGGRRFGEPRDVAPRHLRPVDRARLPRPEIGHAGAELLEPEVDRLLADSPGPEAHDEDAKPVARAARLVDALGLEHRGRPAAYGRASMTTAVPYASTSVTPGATSLAS